MTHEVSRSPVAGATITIFLTVMVLGLGVLTSGIAMAGPPNAANSTFPSLINILDPTGGVPDPDGSFVIIVRDASNNPLPGVTVFVDFSGAPDVSLSNAQPGATLVSCVPPVVSAVTDNNGVASFNIVGAVASQTNNWSPTSTASIRAGSTPLGTTQVKAFDLDGVDGMTVNDLHFMFGPFGQPQP